MDKPLHLVLYLRSYAPVLSYRIPYTLERALSSYFNTLILSIYQHCVFFTTYSMHRSWHNPSKDNNQAFKRLNTIAIFGRGFRVPTYGWSTDSNRYEHTYDPCLKTKGLYYLQHNKTPKISPLQYLWKLCPSSRSSLSICQ